MKPNELRVNNYYLSKELKKPVKCTMEDLCTITIRAKCAEVDEEHVASVFKPMPITVTWLNDNLIPINNVSWDTDGFSTITVEDKDGTWMVSYNDMYLFDVEYVHELQNLYFSITLEELI